MPLSWNLGTLTSFGPLQACNGTPLPLPNRPWDPPDPLFNWYRGFPGGKACVSTNQPLSSAEVKERVKLYICSPSGPSWPVLRCRLPYQIATVRQSVVFVTSLDRETQNEGTINQGLACVTLLASGVLRWLLRFWNVCAAVVTCSGAHSAGVSYFV